MLAFPFGGRASLSRPMKIKFSSKHECAPCKLICNIIIFSLAQQSLRNWTFSLSKPDNEALSALEHGSKQFPLRLPPVQLARWEPFIGISSWSLSLPVQLSAPSEPQNFCGVRFCRKSFCSFVLFPFIAMDIQKLRKQF